VTRAGSTGARLAQSTFRKASSRKPLFCSATNTLFPLSYSSRISSSSAEGMSATPTAMPRSASMPAAVRASYTPRPLDTR